MGQNPAHDDESQPSVRPWDFAPDLSSRRRWSVGDRRDVRNDSGICGPRGHCRLEWAGVEHQWQCLAARQGRPVLFGQTGLQLVVTQLLCGRHSYIGASSANGTMVIDLRGLPGGANLDGGNVTVTPATNLFAVHQA